MKNIAVERVRQLHVIDAHLVYRLLIPLVIALVSGCAFRGEAGAGNDLAPSTNKLVAINDKFPASMYSRNFIVATPTAAANMVCGGTVLYYLDPRGRSPEWYADIAVNTALIAGGACGAVVGLPFIPASYLCEENPWTPSGVNWTCHAP